MNNQFFDFTESTADIISEKLLSKLLQLFYGLIYLSIKSFYSKFSSTEKLFVSTFKEMYVILFLLSQIRRLMSFFYFQLLYIFILILLFFISIILVQVRIISSIQVIYYRVLI